jgi:hypothetical protein
MDCKESDCSALDFDDLDDYAPDVQVCTFCWCESDERVGYNEKEDLLKRACSNCGAIYIEDGQGKIIVVKGEKRDWAVFLSQNLAFPFEAVVEDVEGSDAEIFGYENSYPFRCGDSVKVLDTDFHDDLCGIIAGVRKGRKKYAIPLCDLSVKGSSSHNHKLVDDYKTWFFNYR